MALRRAIIHSTVSSLCITKLDVLDGLDTLRICVGYRIDGKVAAEPPLSVDSYGEIDPVYEEMPGWKASTVGVSDYAGLPAAARAYLERIEALVHVPIDLISTGAERDATIVLRHAFS